MPAAASARPEDLLRLIHFIRDHLVAFSIDNTSSWRNVGWTIERNQYSSFEVYYSYDSVIRMTCNGRDFEFLPENIMLMDNQEANQFQNGSWRIFGFSFRIRAECDAGGDLLNEFRSLMRHVSGVQLGSAQDTAAVVVKIEQDYHYNAKESDLSCFCGILQILLGAYRILVHANDKPTAYISPKCRQIVYSIADHLMEHPESNETLEEIAGRVGLNHRYVNKLFKAMYGQPIQRFRCMTKIRLAKQMLASTGEPVTEIAAKLNFSTSQHFSSVFKKETGFSPKEFRRNCQTMIH